MDFYLGRSDWKTLQRGEEHSFLLVNGLGGYCSQTVIGSNARHDHNLLTAALVAPTKRFAMVAPNRRYYSCGQQCLSSGFTGICYVIR
ncbi:MAG: glycogen debranching enzyme N-terminal domain-containing protein [Lachnospiraceae bacterium]